MAITFKYKKIERPEPVGTTYAPYVPITLIGRKESLNILALLDSGADVSVIPKGIADILGLDLEGKRSEAVDYLA